jgi:TolB-like protein
MEPPRDTPANSAEVRAYVDQLLASPAFSGSPRRARLLRYLVERELAGEGDRVNEYAIGVDVFDKPDSFDTRTESTVRAEFSRLRQKLRDYYAAGGQADRIWVEFPQRSYVPVFTFRDVAARPRPVARTRRPWLWVGLAVVVVAAAAIAAARFLRTPEHPINSIVVLPFENLSPDHHDDYLADGITEELTNDLAQSKNLRVVARTSASLFKGKAVDIREVGRELNVDTAIEGSIEPQGDRIRITAQMNRTSDGYHVWSHSYDASASDILAVQREISRSIAAAVAGSGGKTTDPSAADSTRNPAAHDLFLRANYQRSHNTPESYKQALALFTEATRKDPSYVDAWIGVARAEIDLVHLTVEPPDTAFPAARAALEKALQLDPSCGEARGLLAVLIASYDWDWPRAEQEFRRAIADGAQSPTRALFGALLAMRGRFPEALAEVHVAEDLDPLGTGPRFDEYMVYFLQHNYAAARAVLQAMLKQNPGQFDAHFLLGELDAIEHNCAGARKELVWSAQKFPSPITKIGLAEVSACEGDRRQARAYLAEAQKPDKSGYTSPYESAVVYAAIGDRETALSLLEKSAEGKEMQILYIKYEPNLAPLHADPRFIALEKRVGLEP